MAPLDLPRLVMRRARAVALAFLALSLVLGLAAARIDTQDEVAAALALAQLDGHLQGLPGDDAGALAALRELGPLRHVALTVTDAQGRVRFDAPTPERPAFLRWLAQRLLRNGTAPLAQTVSWSLPRPDGSVWTARVTPSADSEEREALQNLLGLFGLLAACSAAMLVVMQANVRRAFRPLRSLLAAIAGIEREDLAAVKNLPSMPIRELEATSQALKRLASSLEQAQESRRLLAQQVLTLQEDERQRLARDLHDEFGQRLTALRADASWLRRRVGADADATAVAEGMDGHIARIQRDVRDLLARLQPLGASAQGSSTEGVESVERLAALLEALAASWSRPGDAGLRCEACVRVETSPWPPERPYGDQLQLPRSLVLALYRMSQEACTNAARHAGARQVEIDVAIGLGADDSLQVDWTATDDGSGLVDGENALRRGNGLAGMRERAWAHGGSFDWSPVNPPPMQGLRLHARIVRPRQP